MSTKRYNERLHVLLTTDEREMLHALADREGLRPSDMLRQLIRRAHAERFGDAPKATKRGGARHA